MKKDLFWTALAWPGLEHLALREDGDGISADGALIALCEGEPVRLSYRITCDRSWRTRRVEVALPLRGRVERLDSDGDGRWRGAAGEPLAGLDGCVDIDIALTPFTNTLPVRRLDLAAGESRGLRVVYFNFPEFRPAAASQRYTCLERGDGRNLYRYQSGDFSADIAVDDAGLVVTYPDLWQRAT
jgi:hypothetical protein